MRIGLDFDGVIADSSRAKASLLKRCFGVDIAPSLVNKIYLIENGLLSEQEHDELEERFFEIHSFDARALHPVPGMDYYIPRMLEDGHDVSVVSSRKPEGIVLAERWLDRCNISIPMISTGGRDKSEHLRGYDIFVDNDFDKLEFLAYVVPILFLFDWPYNSRINESGMMERVYSWGHLYRKVQEISGRKDT